MNRVHETVFFEKYEGAGNDFIVVDADLPVPNRAAFARTHCDRETGVTHRTATRDGADGVLFLALSEDTRPPRVVMTLVQPDGSVAGMCGNGARCAAAWAARHTDATEFMLDTPAGTRHTVVDNDGVTVEMGRPRFDPDGVPLASDEELVDSPIESLAGTPAEGIRVTAVDTGVPHAVVFVDDVDAVDIDNVAPPIRHADCFPEGANVTFASRDGDGFRQRTYERGVEGETQACGTGAVAIAAAAQRLELGLDADDAESSNAEWTRVSPPGGDLFVSVPESGFARLRGPAEKSFEGILSADPTRDQLSWQRRARSLDVQTRSRGLSGSHGRASSDGGTDVLGGSAGDR